MSDDNSAEVRVQETSTNLPLYQVAQSNSDYLRFKKDTTFLLAKLQELLGAKYWNGERWMRDMSRVPLANDQFINECMVHLLAYVNPNTMQSNMQDFAQAHLITELASEEIILLIGQRSEEFGISETNRDFIWNMIDDLVFFTLTRAVGDLERGHDDNVFKQVSSSRGVGGSVPSSYVPKMFGG